MNWNKSKGKLVNIRSENVPHEVLTLSSPHGYRLCHLPRTLITLVCNNMHEVLLTGADYNSFRCPELLLKVRINWIDCEVELHPSFPSSEIGLTSYDSKYQCSKHMVDFSGMAGYHSEWFHLWDPHSEFSHYQRLLGPAMNNKGSTIRKCQGWRGCLLEMWDKGQIKCLAMVSLWAVLSKNPNSLCLLKKSSNDFLSCSKHFPPSWFPPFFLILYTDFPACRILWKFFDQSINRNLKICLFYNFSV